MNAYDAKIRAIGHRRRMTGESLPEATRWVEENPDVWAKWDLSERIMDFQEFSAMVRRVEAEVAADIAAGRPRPNDPMVTCPGTPASPELRSYLRSLDYPEVKAAEVDGMAADIDAMLRDAL